MSNKQQKIINEFMNENFPITEKNLNKLLNTLRKYDFKTVKNKPYNYKIEDDIIETSYTDFTNKEVGICYTANRLLNAYKNNSKMLPAYKVNFLTSYYHESCHEEQYDKYLQCKSKELIADEYQQIINLDYKYYNVAYNPLCNLNEIDARLNSVIRIVDDIKSGIIKDDKNIYPFILCEIFNMLEGINDHKRIFEFQENPFSADRLLFFYEQRLGKYFSDEFKQNFTKIFEEKLNNFYQNEYKFVVEKVIQNYEPTNGGMVYLTSNWENKINILLQKPTYRNLWILTTDSVNQVKNKSLDFTYRKDDVEEFLISKYNKCDKDSFNAFKNDKESHKQFEKFLTSKYILQKNSTNTLE